MPFPFALVSFLPGNPATGFADRGDYRSIFVQIGSLARQLHTIKLPAFGPLQNPEHSDNATYMRSLADQAFGQFSDLGADPPLTGQLRNIFGISDAIIPATRQTVFAHDDLHPGTGWRIKQPERVTRLPR